MSTTTESGMGMNIEFRLRLLYEDFLQSWNRENADEFASFFAANGNCVGFDGSQMDGAEEIKKQIKQIFQDHNVSSYVGIVQEVRQLSSDVFLLRALAGMMPPGQTEIKPDVNAIQTLILQKNSEDENFRIAVFQNTPAAFHGRPELRDHLTRELQLAANNRNQLQHEQPDNKEVHG